MRKETKIGIVIGIVIAVAAVFYFAGQEKGPESSAPTVPFDEPAAAVNDEPGLIANANSNENSSSDQTETASIDSATDPESASIDTTQESDILPPKTEDSTMPELITDNNPTTASTQPAINTIVKPVTKTITNTKNTMVAKSKAITNDPFADLPDSYPQQMNEPRYHSVTKGDSLYSISTKYFGTGKYWEAIYKANKNTITNASSLRIGWKLRIPSPEEVEAN